MSAPDDELGWITESLVRAVSWPAASVVHFLVRRYPEAPSATLHAAIECALGAALPAFDAEHDIVRRFRWLAAFTDASAMAADDALQVIVEEQLPLAVDALETLMRRVYEPGEGAVDQGCDRQIEIALSLCVAFDLTGRLPYAMLAEELLQTALRTQWSHAAGLFPVTAAANGRAAQLCYRLAALHRDPDYASRAVVAPNARYADVGATVLQAVRAEVGQQSEAIAEYGLAQLDAFALTALPN